MNNVATDADGGLPDKPNFGIEFAEALGESMTIEKPSTQERKYKNFADLLRAIRKAENATLSCLAERLGMSVANLSDLEQGRRLPGPRRAIAIARSLGYPEEEFLARALESHLRRHNINYSVSLKADALSVNRNSQRGAGLQIDAVECREVTLCRI